MKKVHLMALPLAAVLALPALAQNSMPPAPPSNSSVTSSSSQTTPQQPTTTDQNTQTTTDQNNTQTNPNATKAENEIQHEPLQQTHEGFWGHLNPFARKKYVQRQLEPVRGRLNELDELSAKNAKMIQDVDSRATEGIRIASLKANDADQHAIDAGNRAQLAQTTATDASNRLTKVQSAVQTIDQFKPASQVEIRFRPGQSVLSHQAKSALDDLASSVQGQKGYIIEVQGFSAGAGSASVENSQHMAQSVVRYLVINHQVPVYRIYTVGMGNAPIIADDGTKHRVRGGRVEIALLKNGIGDIDVPANNSSSTPSNPPTDNTDNSVQPKNMSTPSTPATQPPPSTTEQPQSPQGGKQ
jgi:outer membrane protein OmpA-like peptidoglycan-associated protein